MKAIAFDRIGKPLDVLELREMDIPPVGDDEVLLQMVTAPISPGDLLFVESLYPEPKKPKFPGQIAGNHGSGIVAEAGKNVQIQPGSFVAFSYYNSWAEYAVIPAEWLMPLPAEFPPEKAGQFFNLITAWDLLSATHTHAGDWIGVTAGNSTVSIMLLQFARSRGVRVIPIVRKARTDLKKLGATEVIALEGSQESVGDQVMTITNGKGLNALVDNVGGPVAGELIRSMALGGQVIINGGMSPDRFELHNFDVLMSGIEIKAHVYRYFFEPPKPVDLKELAEIANASASSDFTVPVGGLNRLEEFRTALQETVGHPEQGKQFFDLRGLAD